MCVVKKMFRSHQISGQIMSFRGGSVQSQKGKEKKALDNIGIWVTSGLC